MSLSRARLIYGCGVAIIAALLISTGSPIHEYAAAILIIAAPLMFRALNDASEVSGATKALKRLREHLTTGEAPGEADPHR